MSIFNMPHIELFNIDKGRIDKGRIDKILNIE